MSAFAPLAWPPAWKKLSSLDRFLLGVPVLGPQAKAYRHLLSQLSRRTRECLSLWGSDVRRRSLADEVSKVITSTLGWPSALFIPDDPFEVLCWDHRAYSVDDLRLEDVVSGIERLIVGTLSEERWKEFMAMTYGAVVDALLTGKGISGSV